MILSHSTSLNLQLLLLGEGIKGLAGDYVAAAAPSTELPPGTATPRGVETHCTHGCPPTRVPIGFLAACPAPETSDGAQQQERHPWGGGSRGHPGARPQSGRAPGPTAWQGLCGTPPGAARRVGSPRILPAGPLADGWRVEDGALGRPMDDALALLPPALRQGPDKDPTGDVSVSLSLAWGISGMEWAMLWARAGGWEHLPGGGRHCGCRLLRQGMSLQGGWCFLTMVAMASGRGHGHGSHKFSSQVERGCNASFSPFVKQNNDTHLL